MSRAVPNRRKKPFSAQLLDGTEVLIAEKLPGVPGGPPIMLGVDGRSTSRYKSPAPSPRSRTSAAARTPSVIDYVSTRVEQ